MLTNISRGLFRAHSAAKLGSRGFCIYAAYLDPRKHITMSHNPNNMYEDSVPLGVYPLPLRNHDKIQSQTYVQPTVDLVFAHLNKKYPNAQLDNKNLNIFRAGWTQFGVNIEADKTEILEILARNLYIKEHKFRYPLEQRLRLQRTLNIFSRINLADTQIGYFFDMYNQLLNISIQRSHFFRAPNVKGEDSFEAKFYEDNSNQPTGVSGLKRNVPENQTLVNRILARLHA